MPGVSFQMLRLRERLCLGCQEVRFGEPAQVSSWELRVPRNDAAPSSPPSHPVLRGHSKEHKGTKCPGPQRCPLHNLQIVLGQGNREGRVADFAPLCRKGRSQDVTQEAAGCGHTDLHKTQFPSPLLPPTEAPKFP